MDIFPRVSLRGFSSLVHFWFVYASEYRSSTVSSLSLTGEGGCLQHNDVVDRLNRNVRTVVSVRLVRRDVFRYPY